MSSYAVMRERLSNRRGCHTFQVRFGNQDFVIGVGAFGDGRPAEAFVTGPKAGTDVQSLSRDGAILLSIALQYGAPLDDIRHAMSRDERENPTSFLGALVDAVAAERRHLLPPDEEPAPPVEPRSPSQAGGPAAVAVEAVEHL